MGALSNATASSMFRVTATDHNERKKKLPNQLRHPRLCRKLKLVKIRRGVQFLKKQSRLRKNELLNQLINMHKPLKILTEIINHQINVIITRSKQKKRKCYHQWILTKFLIVRIVIVVKKKTVMMKM